MSSTQNMTAKKIRMVPGYDQDIKPARRFRKDSEMDGTEYGVVYVHRGMIRPMPVGFPHTESMAETLRKGNKTEALRRLQEQTGLSEKDAAETVEALQKWEIDHNQGNNGIADRVYRFV